MRFLLVEEDLTCVRAVQREVRLAFPRAEVDVVETEAGFAGALRDSQPDVILCAMELRRWDSFSALRMVRELPSDRPFLALAEVPDVNAALRLVKAGADDYVLKFRLDSLGDAVRQAVQRRAQRPSAPGASSRPAQWELDLARRRISVSPDWKSMAGLGPEETLSRLEEWLSLTHPDDVLRLTSAIRAWLTGAPQPRLEYRIRHSDGGYRRVALLDAHLVQGVPEGTARLVGGQISLSSDDTPSAASVRCCDPGTLLPTREVFLERVGHALHHLRRNAGPTFAVLVVELDGMRRVNLGFGESKGDSIMTACAERAKSCLSRVDTLARLSEDSFAVLLESAGTRSDVARVAQRVMGVVRKPLGIDEAAVLISPTVGGALATRDHDSARRVLRDAEAALDQARSRGRRWAFFSPEVVAQARHSLEIAVALERALTLGELTARYQPIVSLEAGRLIGFEALARWAHPTQGLLVPAQFLEVAEETGLILKLGDRILEDACDFAKSLDRTDSASGATVSVNLSTQELLQPDLLRRVTRILEKTGVDGRRLRLELTERALLRRPDHAARLIRELRMLGISLDIDDFGTGYSSFAYLTRLPIDGLKIDRSFVEGVARDERRLAVIRSLASLAAQLQAVSFIEGVTCAEEFEALRASGCACAQGFFFGAPMDAPDARALVAGARNPPMPALSGDERGTAHVASLIGQPESARFLDVLLSLPTPPRSAS